MAARGGGLLQGGRRRELRLRSRHQQLGGLPKELSSVATELVNRQEESERSHKRLIELSRDFKRNAPQFRNFHPQEIREMVAPLLKSFQTEVVALSRRSKEAEAVFLNVYKQLIGETEVAVSLGPARTLEEESWRLPRDAGSEQDIRPRQPHRQPNTPPTQVTDHSPVGVRLGVCNETRRSSTDDPQPTERSLTPQHDDERERGLEEAQHTLAARLGEAEEKIMILHSALKTTQTELLLLRCKYDEETASKTDEVEMIMTNLEKANQRAEAAQREVESLREQLILVTSRGPGCHSLPVAGVGELGEGRTSRSGSPHSLDAMADKDQEIARLLKEIQRLQGELWELRETSASQVASLERELAEKTEFVERLEEKLCIQLDYQEIKTELSVLKSTSLASRGDCGLQGPVTRGEGFLAGTEVTSEEGESSQREDRNTHPDVGSADEDQPDEVLTGGVETPSPSPRLTVDPSPSPAPALTPTSLSDDPPVPGFLKNTEGTPGYPGGLHSAWEASLAAGGTEAAAERPESILGLGDEEGFDTTEIAFQVKEQLLKHNIGQRVFGHYILALSQGSVSEILARPKPWHKLTVKGKEPFIKMKQFLSDEQNILALRTIQVRQRGSITPRIRTPETGSDDAIKSILEQAKRELQTQKCVEPKDSPILASSGNGGNSGNPGSHDNGSGPGGGSDEAIRSILEAAQREMQAQRRTLLAMEGAGGGEEENAASLYGPPAQRQTPTPAADRNQLLLLLPPVSIKQEEEEEEEEGEGEENGGGLGGGESAAHPPPGPVSPAAFVQNIIRQVKSEIGDAGSYFEQHWATEQSGSGSQRLETSPSPSSLSSSSSTSSSSSSGSRESAHGSHQGPETGEEPGPAEEGARRRKRRRRRAEVTVKEEELQPPAPAETPTLALASPAVLPAYAHRSPKPTVPPLTPEQYEVYMYREVETAELTRQVKEKLAKSGICQRIFGEKVLGLSQGSVSDMLSRPKPWGKLTQKGREPFIRMQLWLVGKLEQTESLGEPRPAKSLYSPSPPPSPPEWLQGVEEMPGAGPESSKENQQPASAAASPSPSLSPAPPRGKSLTNGQPPGGIQDLVATSTELDTYSITKRVKEVLTDNNVGQRLFGESILGLTQGSVSDLLSRPKPWHKLSLKGREPFVRMQLWLNDPYNVARLRDMKKIEKKAYLKRRYGLINAGSDSDSPSNHSESASPGPPAHGPPTLGLHHYQSKKPRVVLGLEEKEMLREAYQLEPYPSQQNIKALASKLHLRTNTVINWFHNYRSRIRRELLMREQQGNDTDPELAVTVGREGNELGERLGSPELGADERKSVLGKDGGPSRSEWEPVAVKQEEEEGDCGFEYQPGGSITAWCQAGWVPGIVKRERMGAGYADETRYSPKPTTVLHIQNPQCLIIGCNRSSTLSPSPSASPEASDDIREHSSRVYSVSRGSTATENGWGGPGGSGNPPSVTSSPGLLLSISPVPSSASSSSYSNSAPSPAVRGTPAGSESERDTAPGPGTAAPVTTSSTSRLNRSVQRRNEKMANLNNIIHRLEKAANREEPTDWEF